MKQFSDDPADLQFYFERDVRYYNNRRGFLLNTATITAFLGILCCALAMPFWMTGSLLTAIFIQTTAITCFCFPVSCFNAAHQCHLIHTQVTQLKNKYGTLKNMTEEQVADYIAERLEIREFEPMAMSLLMAITEYQTHQGLGSKAKSDINQIPEWRKLFANIFNQNYYTTHTFSRFEAKA